MNYLIANVRRKVLDKDVHTKHFLLAATKASRSAVLLSVDMKSLVKENFKNFQLVCINSSRI